MAPMIWGQSPHFMQRGEAGRQALSLRAAWTPCVLLKQSISTSQGSLPCPHLLWVPISGE